MAPVLPEVPADPDLRFADSNAGDSARKSALNLYDCWTAIERQMQRVTESNKGARIDRAVALWQSQIQRLKAAQDNANAAATMHGECAEAGRKYRASAPSQEEFDAKRAEYETACRKVQETADDGGYSYVAAKTAQTRSRSEFGDLIARKKAAVEAFEHAEDQAAATFASARQPMPQGEWGTYGSTPTTPAPHADAPAPAPTTAPGPAPAPENTAPTAPFAPETPAPATPLAAPPASETVTSAGTGGGLDSKSLLAGALLQQAQQQAAPQPQMQAQMPQMAAPQPQPQPNRQAAKNLPTTPEGGLDLAAIAAQAGLAPSALVGLANGLGTTVTSASPAITPAVTTPTYSPAAPWSTASLAGTAPTNPVTTGTSISGLSTDSNVTGRPDNVAARNAFTATATGSATSPSHLSGTQAGGAAGSAGAAGAATAGAPVGGMPMMGGPMMGGPGGGNGGASQRDAVKANPDSDQWLLTGGPTVDAAVAGGTIAQRKDDAA